MPEALATTKRKFYKFLDTLSTPQANASTSTQPNPKSSHRLSLISLRGQTGQQHEPTAKRLRPETSSVTTTSTRAPSIASVAHRARPTSALLSEPGRPSTSSSSIRRIASTASLPNKSGESGTIGSTKEHIRVELPSFCPWSHEGFLERLRTFAPVTRWMPKPDEAVGEVRWAKRGWSCVSVEMVACAACGARIKVDFSPPPRRNLRSNAEHAVGSENAHANGAQAGDIEPQEDKDENVDEADELMEYEETFERGLVARYSGMIVEGHNSGCLWRQSGCKNDIYRLPVVRTAWWQQHLRTSYASSLNIAEDVGAVKLKKLDAQPTAAKIFRDTPTTFWASASGTGEENSPSEDLSVRALTIALTGWTATTDSGTNLLACEACFQRVGLWMYVSPNLSNATIASADDADEEPNGTSPVSASILDLVDQHREHCPFRNAASQAATGPFADMPGWQILWTTVARFADEQRRRSRDRYSIAVDVTAGTSAVDDPGLPQEAETVHVESTGEHAEIEQLTASPVVGSGYLARMETAKLDRERTNKLRRLKKALGIKVRVPEYQTRSERERAAAIAAAAAAAATVPSATTSVVDMAPDAAAGDITSGQDTPSVEAGAKRVSAPVASDG